MKKFSRKDFYNAGEIVLFKNGLSKCFGITAFGKETELSIYCFETTVTAISIPAFVAQHNCTFVYYSMKEPNLKDWQRMTHFVVFTSWFIMSLFSTFGYITFLDLTQGL